MLSSTDFMISLSGKEIKHCKKHLLNIFWIKDRTFSHFHNYVPTLCKKTQNTAIFHPEGNFTFGNCHSSWKSNVTMIAQFSGKQFDYCSRDVPGTWWNITKMSWTEAAHTCASLGSFLPVLRTREEMEEFIGFIKNIPQFVSSLDHTHMTEEDQIFLLQDYWKFLRKHRKYLPRDDILGDMWIRSRLSYFIGLTSPSALSNEVIFIGLIEKQRKVSKSSQSLLSLLWAHKVTHLGL